MQVTIIITMTTHHAHDHGHHHHDHAEGEACNHIVDARELAGPFDWRKILAVVLLRRHQAVHGGDPRAHLRADARHVLGRRRRDLRHGARHRHYRRGACHAWRLARANWRLSSAAGPAPLPMPCGRSAPSAALRSSSFSARPCSRLRSDRRGRSKRGEPSSARSRDQRRGLRSCIRHGAISAGPGTYCSLVSRPENSVSICRAGLHSASKAS